MSDQVRCQVNQALATRFCTCAGIITALCEGCVSLHEQQVCGELHNYEPITYFPLAQSVGLDSFLLRKSQMLKATILGKKLREVEKRQYEETRRKIRELEEDYMKRLDTLHGCFDGLMERFNKEKLLSLSTEEPKISAFTAAILRSKATKIQDETEMIDMKPVQELESELHRLDKRVNKLKGPKGDFDPLYAEYVKRIATEDSDEEKITQPDFVTVPFSRGSQLALWRSDNQELRRVELSCSLKLTYLSVSVFLPDGNLISCGGHNPPHERQVAHINTTSGEISFLPDMFAGRANAGIVYYENFLYAFGGFSPRREEHKSGEKYDIQGKEWKMIEASMATQRHQFTPCIYERVIYLPGGWTTNTVETFEIATESFSVLSLTLPNAFPAVSLVYNGELVIFQGRRLIRWALGSNTNEGQVSAVRKNVKDSTIQVQIVGTKAYWTQEDPERCKILEVNLTDWTVTKVGDLKVGGS